MEIHKLNEGKVADGAGLDIIDSTTSHTLKVTELRPAIVDGNRVNIFVNDKFEFSLTVAQVVEFKVKAGMEISDEKLQELKHASEFGKLYQRALEKALSRPHSKKEMRDYLLKKRLKRMTENKIAIENRKKPVEMRKQLKLRTTTKSLYTDEDIEQILARLTEKGYLDEVRFAEYFVENRHLKKGTSIRKLRQELQKKGVADEIINEALARTGRNDVDELKKAIAKKANKMESDKLISYLARQGFDYQLVKELLPETDLQSWEQNLQ